MGSMTDNDIQGVVQESLSMIAPLRGCGLVSRHSSGNLFIVITCECILDVVPGSTHR